MFEKATRLKLKFTTPQGILNIEDLWDLPLTSAKGRANLDDVARELHKQLRNDDDVSFVFKERKSDSIIQLKFDLVKHIIDVRIAENESKALEKSNAEQKQKILAIIADRKDDELKGKSLEELMELAQKLG